MLRILIVEPDPLVRRAASRALRSDHRRWMAQVAGTAAEAERMLSAGGVDVVMTELHLPDRDGLHLLDEIATSHPDVIRILWSAASCPERGVEAARVAHQWITKPAGRAVLIEVLEKVERLRRLCRNPVARAVAGTVDRLPAVPAAVVATLTDLRQPQVDLDRVATTIEYDPALSARVLQLASSSFIRPGRDVTTVRDAVHRVGREALIGIVVAAALEIAFADRAGEAAAVVAERGFRAAGFAAELAERRHIPRAEIDAAVTAALLRDVGALAVAAWQDLDGSATSRLVRERRLSELDCTVGELGAYLLGLWNLPESVVVAVERHESPPSRQSPDPAAVVHVAARMADGDVSGLDVRWMGRVGWTEVVHDLAAETATS